MRLAPDKKKTHRKDLGGRTPPQTHMAISGARWLRMGLSNHRKNAACVMVAAMLAEAVWYASVPHCPFLRNPSHRIVKESVPAYTPSTILEEAERFLIML